MSMERSESLTAQQLMMASGTTLVYHGVARMVIGESILMGAFQMEGKDYQSALPYQVDFNTR